VSEGGVVKPRDHVYYVQIMQDRIGDRVDTIDPRQ
jgi:hypothetical protein